MDIVQANIDDAKTLFDLRNLDSNRVNFRNPEKVIWQDHITWLERFFSNNVNKIFLFRKDLKYVGQFRVDSDGDVSVSLFDEFKGVGLGKIIIYLGTLEYLKLYPRKALIAEVKKNNKSSIKAFSSAGYREKSVNDEYVIMEYVNGN